MAPELPPPIAVAIPDELVEEIIIIAWAQRYLRHRWQLYRTMLRLCHQWQAIARHLCLQLVILDSPSDTRNYVRLISRARADIRDKEKLHEYFSRTHVRADVSALVVPPMLPSCRSLEFTNEGRQKSSENLNSWLRIPGLTSAAFFDVRINVISQLPLTLTYVHYHLEGIRQVSHELPRWLKVCLRSATRLRISSPQPLIPFIRFAPNLEELIVDLHGFADIFYTIVAALKAGILHGSRKKLILNTGPDEPSCYSAVAAACKRLGVTLERRIVYEECQILSTCVSLIHLSGLTHL